MMLLLLGFFFFVKKKYVHSDVRFERGLMPAFSRLIRRDSKLSDLKDLKCSNCIFMLMQGSKNSNLLQMWLQKQSY